MRGEREQERPGLPRGAAELGGRREQEPRQPGEHERAERVLQPVPEIGRLGVERQRHDAAKIGASD